MDRQQPDRLGRLFAHPSMTDDDEITERVRAQINASTMSGDSLDEQVRRRRELFGAIMETEYQQAPAVVDVQPL